MKNFSISEFARECKDAMAKGESRLEAAKSYLEATIKAFPVEEIVSVLEEAIPAGADIGEMIVHASPELTMLYARVPGRFRSGIHNHTVFACIGQLTGEEMNTVYQPDGDGLRVDSKQHVRAGEVLSLAEDAIHNIENPLPTVSRSLHIYGGDFGALMEDRSLWASDDYREKAFSFPALLEESVRAMQRDGNDVGITELAKAIPSVRPLLDS
jgi:predicted metal-dependent enzyme (double-stranded beta helix superfamily)